jgi:hypothetical protein
MVKYFPPHFTHLDRIRLDWLFRKLKAYDIRY